jgi:hypothetical protein
MNMTTIELNGVTLILTEKTAEEIKYELKREERERARKREEQKRHWMMWHWYARRWAMYGNKFDYDGAYFSDMYKDENGIRPRMSREEIFWILYGRECWVEHGQH